MEKPKRWLVVPGDVVTERRVKLGPNVFVEGGKVYSKVVGLAEVCSPALFTYVKVSGYPVSWE